MSGAAAEEKQPTPPPPSDHLSSAALARARKKRATARRSALEEDDGDEAYSASHAILPAALLARDSIAPASKQRRNASFINSAFGGAVATAGVTNSPATGGFEGGVKKAGFFHRRRLSSDDEEDVSPTSTRHRPRLRSRNLSLAEAIDPRALSIVQPGDKRPSLADATSSIRDVGLRAVIDLQREEEDERRQAAGEAAAQAPAAAAATTTATGAATTRGVVVAALTQEELEQQVLDEWTSSDEDDVSIPAEFKTSTLLSRTTRRAYGLRSMREVMNLLAAPLAKRDYPLQEYAQSGAFQGVSYWPANGRFRGMRLTDSQPTHSNPAIADPRAPIVKDTVAALAGKTPPRGTVAHSRHQSLHKSLFSHHHRKTTLDGTTMAEGFLKPVLATDGEGSPPASPALTPRSGAGSGGGGSSRLGNVFSMLDEAALNLTDAEAAAVFTRNAARLKKTQAVHLYAAAQSAPFVKLRRDLETNSQKDAFSRFLASDRPLLSDAQIDALLQAKIDESVRKGFPRNRAEMRGLNTRGAVSFGQAKDSSASSLEREVDQMIQFSGGMSNSLGPMFRDDRYNREKHTARNLKGIHRPFSAYTPAQKKAVSQVAAAWNHTREVNRANPPVGAYNPSYVATSADLAVPGVDLSRGSARDRALEAGLGLGAAQTLRSSLLGNLANLAQTSLTSAVPGPADTQVVRLFDDKSDSAQRTRPGSAFSMADVGMRTAIMSESGVAKQMVAGSFDAVQRRGKELADPVPFKPLSVDKVYSSIGGGPKVSFANARAQGTVHSIYARSTTNSRHVLQYTSTSTMGPHAHLPHAPKPPATKFGSSKRPTSAQADGRTRREAPKSARAKPAVSAAEAASQQRKAVRAQKQATEVARRDAAFAALTAERRVGLMGARELVLAKQAEAAAASSTDQKEEEEEEEDSSSDEDSPAPVVLEVLDDVASQQQQSSSDFDSDSSLTAGGRASRILRAQLGPMSNFTPEAKTARLAHARNLRLQRQRHARSVRDDQARQLQQGKPPRAVKRGPSRDTSSSVIQEAQDAFVSHQDAADGNDDELDDSELGAHTARPSPPTTARSASTFRRG